jgi:hypothetical protein
MKLIIEHNVKQKMMRAMLRTNLLRCEAVHCHVSKQNSNTIIEHPENKNRVNSLRYYQKTESQGWHDFTHCV